MAQQPYMGSGLLVPPFSEVTKWLANWPRYYSIDPDVSARAIWQAVRRLGWEMEALNLAYVIFSFMPVRFFYMP
jgi:hypothetical protein